MKKSPANVRFVDALKVCEAYFGTPRIHGSHHVFKTPWRGDPRLNLQKDGNKAKRYQVMQILRALDQLRHNEDAR